MRSCTIFFVILNPRKGLILNKESRLITLRLKRDVENYDLMRTKGMKPGGRVNIRSHIQEELNGDIGTQKNDPECPHQVPATLIKVGILIDALRFISKKAKVRPSIGDGQYIGLKHLFRVEAY